MAICWHAGPHNWHVWLFHYTFDDTFLMLKIFIEVAEIVSHFPFPKVPKSKTWATLEATQHPFFTLNTTSSSVTQGIPGTSSTWNKRQVTITTQRTLLSIWQAIIHRVHLTNQKNHKANTWKGKLVSERISLHISIFIFHVQYPIPRPASQKTFSTMIPETYVLLAPDLVTNIIVVVTFVGIISAKSTALNECIKFEHMFCCFHVFWRNFFDPKTAAKHPCHEMCYACCFSPQCCDWFRCLFNQDINLFSFLSSSNIGPSSRLKMWIW